MADNGLGFSLEIPDKFLEDAKLADLKIAKLAFTSSQTSEKIVSAFKQMTLTGVQPFLDKLNEANKSLSNFKIGNVKMPKTEVDKFTDSATKAALALNKVSNPQTSVSAWTGLANNITQLERKSESLVKSTKEYELTMSRINSGKGGTVSLSDKSTYENNLKELEATRATIASYKEKQATIIAYQKEQKKVTDNALALRNLESERTSLPEQRKADELKKMSEYYKAEEISSKKAHDAKIAASEKEVKATERKINAEKRLVESQERISRRQGENRNYREGLNELNAYNRAMAASEATITQRTNKIARLTQVEQQLSASSRNYSSEVAKIRETTDRLNKTNTEAASKMETFKKAQGSAGDVAGQLTRKLALVFSVSQIQGYVMNMIKVRGEFELQNRALQAILQNKDEANKLFGRITELAVRSPFQVKELVTYTKQLAAYRVETEKLYDTTKMLADVSAGLGVDMSRLILAYGQVKAANYLRGTELRQFSEAGINILGELATYYTELEGRMVRVGDVQARVTKRMVSFGDVEEVFKRITSAGGIFYNMQEIQAETLSGQISNLTDSIDIMFNSIGKANDSTLKNAVSAVRTMVENWQVFEAIIKGAGTGFVLYTIKVTAATIANKIYGNSVVDAATKQGFLTKAIYATGNAFKSAFAWIAKNPLIAVAAVLVGVGVHLYNQAKAAEALREKYNTLNNSIETQKSKLDSLVSSIEKQDAILKESNNSLSKAKKGTEEYSKAEEEGNKASKNRNDLLAQLKKQFPEVYEGLGTQKTKTENLKNAQEEYNKTLQHTITLNKLIAMGGVDISAESVAANAGNEKRKQAASDLEATYKAAVANMRFFISQDEVFAKRYEADFNKINKSSDSTLDKLMQISTLMKNTQYVDTSTELRKEIEQNKIMIKDATDSYTEAVSTQKKNVENLENGVQTFIKSTLKMANVSVEGFKEMDKEAQQGILKSLTKSAIELFPEGYAQLFAKRRLKQELGVDIVFNKPKVEEDLGQVKDAINKEVENLKKNFKGLVIQPITGDEEQDTYFQVIISNMKNLQKEADRVSKSTKKVNDNLTNEAYAKQLNEQAGALRDFAASYGVYEKGAENKALSKEEQRLKNQFDLLKKIQSEYEKIEKISGKNVAIKETVSNFTQSFKEAELGDIMTMQFDKEAFAKKLESIMPKVGSKMRDDFQKAIAELRGELTIEIKTKNIEEFERDLDEVFSGYELSFELDKKGFDKDLMKQLFDIDSFDISDLRKKIEDQFPDLGALGEKELESYYKAIKKLSDFENKQIKNQVKIYSEYFIKSKDERVAINEEGLRQIAEMEKLNKFTPDMKKQAKTKIQAETTEKLAQVDFKELKALDMYKLAFEDLERVGTTSLNLILGELERFASSSGKNLPITEYKELMSLIKKIREQVEENDPFKAFINSVKEYKDAVRQAVEAQRELESAKDTLSMAGSAKKEAETNVRIAQQEYNIAPESQKAEALDKLSRAQDMATMATEDYKIAEIAVTTAIGKGIVADNQKVSSLNKMKESVSNANKKFGDLTGALTSAIDLAKGLADGLGMSFSPETSAVIDSIGKAIGVVSAALSVMVAIIVAVTVAGTALIPLLAIAAALASVFAIIAIGDAKKEKQIQKEKDRVEELQVQYEELNRLIEKGYSFDQYSKATDRIKNMEEQIKSYKAMISAEQDKKKTDSNAIKGWEKDINDLRNSIEDIFDDMRENIIGSFKDISKTLGDSIIDAFLAGEDQAKAWGDSVNDIVSSIVKNLIVQKFLEPKIAELVDQYYADIMPKQTKAEQAYAKYEEALKSDTKIDISRFLSDKQYQKDILNSKKNLSKLKKDYENAVAQAENEVPKISEGATDKFANGMNDLQEYMEGVIPEWLGKFGESAESDLTGMQKSVQGVTEDTAQVLEATLSSIRFFVAQDSTTLTNLYKAFISNNLDTNPIYGELAQQTAILRSIDNRLASVIKSGWTKGGGSFIKVDM